MGVESYVHVVIVVNLLYSMKIEMQAPCPYTPTTGSPTPAPQTTAAPTTEVTTTVASTTQPPRLCALDDGYTVLAINFLNYSNPSDYKSTGILCDTGLDINGTVDNCDLVFEICVSGIDTPRLVISCYILVICVSTPLLYPILNC